MKFQTGPNGEKRPVDPAAAANMVAKIATREVDEKPARRIVLEFTEKQPD